MILRPKTWLSAADRDSYHQPQFSGFADVQLD